MSKRIENSSLAALFGHLRVWYMALPISHGFLRPSATLFWAQHAPTGAPDSMPCTNSPIAVGVFIVASCGVVWFMVLCHAKSTFEEASSHFRIFDYDLVYLIFNSKALA